MYSIGQLALILKVSTRTLRHYDDIGLLKPNHVNEQNGYRYYEKDQMILAKNIVRLKECGLSLEEIKEIIINNNGNTKEIIKKRLSIIEEEITNLNSMKNNLHGILQEEEITKDSKPILANHKIECVELDNINVISKKCRIDIRDIGKVVGLLYEEINKNGLRIKGGHIVKYFENEYDPENADVEVCIPVENRKEWKGKINTIPKGRYATAAANSISEKGDVHEAIINWANSNRYKIAGNPFEQYNVNYQNGLFKIDIYYPLA